jgi:hypothetical protein
LRLIAERAASLSSAGRNNPDDRYFASDSAAMLASSKEKGGAMQTLPAWFAERGAIVAAAVDQHSDAICDRVAGHMAAMFPNLCYDPIRFDAASFQQKAFRETPRRFHRLLQVALLCQSMAIIEREYRWAWKILMRHNVERRHMLAHMRWYFEEVFSLANLSSDDKRHLVEVRDEMLHMIERVTITSPVPLDTVRKQARANGNGNGNGNGVHH